MAIMFSSNAHLLIDLARDLIGNDLDTVDTEYIRGQAELITDFIGDDSIFDDHDQLRAYVIREISGLDLDI